MFLLFFFAKLSKADYFRFWKAENQDSRKGEQYSCFPIALFALEET